ncbi:MAG: uracil-DNA glycosylase [Gammaproteobacteria bacterium]|nr:uracil-DNA glycosylase [Gammaproteobacteria bacterium]
MSLDSSGWSEALAGEKDSPHFRQAMSHVKARRAAGVAVYPAQDQIFAALKHTPLEDVRAVILGQDPYHGPGQAHGLCFSVQAGVAPPPSLKNIFKELASDLGSPLPGHGCLSAWAEHGVLLLNTVLTVEDGQAHSHRGIGWETFTDRVIREVSQRRDHVVFLLWGAPAMAKRALIDPRHTILTAPHPSPLSAHRGFFGCRHFSKANAALIRHGQCEIDWRL